MVATAKSAPNLHVWLFELHNMTVAQLAGAIGVDPAFLQNVADGRQPMPIEVAERAAAYFASAPSTAIATVYPSDVASILSQCPLWTPLRGPLQLRAVPPDPLSAFNAPVYAPTMPPVTPSSTVQYPRQLWTVGPGIGDLGFNGAMVATRDAALTFVDFTHVQYDANQEDGALCYDGTYVWTFGSLSGGTYYGARLSTNPPAVVVEGTAFTYARPTDMVFEPATATVWLTNGAGPGISKLNPDLSQATFVTLFYGGQEYVPAGMTTVGGKLYICARYTPGSGAPDGRLFEVDAATATITRVSAGPSMGGPWGVDYDPVRAVFYVAADLVNYDAGSQIQPAVWTVDRATLTAAQITVTGPSSWPGFAGLRWVSYLYGRLWLSGYESALHVLDPSGEVVQFREFGPGNTGVYLGRVAADPPSTLYVADPFNNAVHAVNPANVGADAFAYDVSQGAGGAYAYDLLIVDPGVTPPLVP